MGCKIISADVGDGIGHNDKGNFVLGGWKLGGHKSVEAAGIGT